MMYSNPGDWTINDLRILKGLCANSTLATARLYFKLRDSTRFLVSHHHRLIAQTLDRVANGEIKRLIINIPPGYTKTELAVMFFVLKSYIGNPMCRFIHASYSASLAERNSAVIRNMTQLPMFQALADFEKREDLWAKKWWGNTAGGEFLGVSSDGQVTGFRAGHMDKSRFTGAILIDDPNKPADVFSKVIRESINFNFSNTFVPSRLAHDDVPVIVIQQRTHDMDLSGFLLRGGENGDGEKWHHLLIPARITELNSEYPEKYTHGIPIPLNLPVGPIWPFKQSDEKLDKVQEGNPFLYATQYQQDPSDPSARIFHRDWFGRWDVVSGIDRLNAVFTHDGTEVRIQSLHVYADTAMKTGETNDYSVFQLWALGTNGKIYLMDMMRGKWEAPELEQKAVEFFNRWAFVRHQSNIAIQRINIEDKASGTGLIQTLNRAIDRGALNAPKITPIPRHKDKVARAYACQSAVERGDVCVPSAAPWLRDFFDEVEAFNANMTHSHDDQLDPMFDAITDLIIDKQSSGYYNIV